MCDRCDDRDRANDRALLAAMARNVELERQQPSLEERRAAIQAQLAQLEGRAS